MKQPVTALSLTCIDQIKLSINGPPLKSTPSQLGADPPSKARWLIAGGGNQRSLTGTAVEHTDTQEASDDTREC